MVPAFISSPPPTFSRTGRICMSAAPGSTDSTPATPQDRHVASDWRAFRAHLVASQRINMHALHFAHPSFLSPTRWAHPQPNVEVGCVLLANSSYKWPTAFQHLQRAVVLITDVTPNGVSGLLLSRLTKYRVGTHRSVLGRVGKPFESNWVRLGGDCSTGSLEVLHGISDDVCEGAREIVPGLWRGGFNASRKLVGNGERSAGEFHFFVAYSKWTLEQMDAERKAGAWNVISCAPGVLLEGLNEGHQNYGADLWEDINRLLPSDMQK